MILLDGKRVKLQLWDTSGQGRFSTILRSYSRGTQGVLLVYDITNKWSFDSMDRWLKEVEEVRFMARERRMRWWLRKVFAPQCMLQVSCCSGSRSPFFFSSVSMADV